MAHAYENDIALAIKAFKIGNKIRELRQKNRYTLQDLAEKTGLSKPFLSQIENNRVVPPVATLLRLARGLNVGISFFFEDGEDSERISITRPEDRVRIERRPHQEKGEVNFVYVALESRLSHKNMEPYLVEFPVQDADRVVFMNHEGEEFLYVMEGQVEFRTIDRVELLEPGDSIYIESDVSHSFRCMGGMPAKALAVLWSKPNG